MRTRPASIEADAQYGKDLVWIVFGPAMDQQATVRLVKRRELNPQVFAVTMNPEDADLKSLGIDVNHTPIQGGKPVILQGCSRVSGKGQRRIQRGHMPRLHSWRVPIDRVRYRSATNIRKFMAFLGSATRDQCADRKKSLDLRSKSLAIQAIRQRRSAFARSP